MGRKRLELPAERMCRECRVRKAIELFSTSNTTRYGKKQSFFGYRWVCKSCVSKKATKRQKRNRADGKCWCGRPSFSPYVHCPACLQIAAVSRLSNLETKRIQGKEYRKILKLSAFSSYGNRCACCPQDIIECLEIDHIGGWGTKHRDKFGRRISGQSLFRWLRDHNYPKGFRILCGSCHSAISYWGYCPCQERLQAKVLADAAALATINSTQSPVS